MFGFVYFIASDRGSIKIGWSSDVAKRFRTLETGSPDALTLLGFIPGDRAREKELHGQWKDQRVRLEWYRDTKELREFIAQLLEAPPTVPDAVEAEWEDDPIFVENVSLFLKTMANRQEGEAVSAAIDRLCDLLCLPPMLIYRLWYQKCPTISAGLYRKIEEVAASEIGDVLIQRRINRPAFALAENSLAAIKRAQRERDANREPA